jgi:hypothetical protein
MRRIVFLCLAGLLVAGAALAEDIWEKKDYMHWTDEEVKKVMTNSPWAKDVTITAPPSALGRGQRPAAPTEEAANTGGGGRGGRGGRGGGGGGGAGGGEALLVLNMSWRSALPLRMALVRSRLGAAAAIPPEAQQLLDKEPEEYVLIVSGVPTGMARAANNEVLLSKSTIRFGKKPPVAPKGVDFQTRTQSVDIVFVFPKTQVAAAEDKEVEVILKLDTVEVKRKFNLKDMVRNGKLEL